MKLKPIFLSLSRFLARMAIQEGVRRALPAVYARIDAALPNLLLEGNPPVAVEKLISQAIFEATGLKPKPSDVYGVDALYSAIAAAVPLRNRLLR